MEIQFLSNPNTENAKYKNEYTTDSDLEKKWVTSTYVGKNYIN